jgi:hypothetical protein
MISAIKNILVVGILLASPLLSTNYSQVTEFYIAPGGNDTNPGTEEKPFATLNRARNAVRD